MYAFVCRPSVCPRVATGVLVDRAGRAEAAYPNIPERFKLRRGRSTTRQFAPSRPPYFMSRRPQIGVTRGDQYSD